MKAFNNLKIIGIDHGYGNIKTANHCFKTGIVGYDSEPLFTKDMLVYDGRYYLIGEGHKEFLAEKHFDNDYYCLTLVAIAKELKAEDLTEADVVIAAGLPLTWTSGQKKAFAEYLRQKDYVTLSIISTLLMLRYIRRDILLLLRLLLHFTGYLFSPILATAR